MYIVHVHRDHTFITQVSFPAIITVTDTYMYMYEHTVLCRSLLHAHVEIDCIHVHALHMNFLTV